MYCSSTRTYKMLGMKDTPNTYGDLLSGQGTLIFFNLVIFVK